MQPNPIAETVSDPTDRDVIVLMMNSLGIGARVDIHRLGDKGVECFYYR
ncbi:hypothetical protein ACYVVI_06350 [Arenicellales bacterium IMCC57338]